MSKEQAIRELEQCLAALFPYPNPWDDPDQRRAADQIRCREALDVLSREAINALQPAPSRAG